MQFGDCYLALAVPAYGVTADVSSLDELLALPCWTKETPLRVVSGYQYLARTFFERVGFEHVELVAADGALEAAPAMGAADIILDLVSTGTTLRENNLKEIAGGRVLESQGVLVANRQSLLERSGCLETVRCSIHARSSPAREARTPPGPSARGWLLCLAWSSAF